MSNNLKSVAAHPDLMPVPRRIEWGTGRFRLGKTFRVSVVGNPDERIFGAASRFLRRLDNRTGLFIEQALVAPGEPSDQAGLTIAVQRPGSVELGEDESYEMRIGESGITLETVTDLGAMHGLETLLQALGADELGYYWPVGRIEDGPRFPWRGLMIDASRHFMPVEVIKRNLDGMAAVKLNVLHWHLCDDQGFRIELESYPRLHQMGSDGLFYTKEQVKEVVAYAASRGIRVYPELDVPGHATAWLVGHPEMASQPGPYQIERSWGIFKPTLDPSKEVVYEILEAVFAEVASLFPDRYFHIGGDEVEGTHWQESEGLRDFMRDNGLADKQALQAHFNQRILRILTKIGKTMIGWDEILHPEMPKEVMIHSWQGRDSMVKAAQEGYSSILSNGYYIDLLQPASEHYLVDPLPADIGLSEQERRMVFGGEATMWSEHVTIETVDSRIWPRTAAIAERLWSAREVRDVEDMYRRLETVSLQLEELGLTHLSNREAMMRRLAGGFDIEPIRLLADVVEPLKIYRRNEDLSYRSHSPYTLLPDVAVADARGTRLFKLRVEAYLSDGDANALFAIRGQLQGWAANHDAFAELAARSPALREALPLSSALRELAGAALKALDGESVPLEEALDKARLPVAKVELQVVDAVERLLGRAK